VANGHAGTPWETRTAASAEGAVQEKRGVAAQDEGVDSRWCIANLSHSSTAGRMATA